MSWLSDLIFRRKEEETVAHSAKNRLKLVLIHDRESRDGPDFLPQLKLDIIAAIKKYVQINDHQVQVNVSQKDDTSMMEVSVSLDPQFDSTVPEGTHQLYDNEEELDEIKSVDEEEKDKKNSSADDNAADDDKEDKENK